MEKKNQNSSEPAPFLRAYGIPLLTLVGLALYAAGHFLFKQEYSFWALIAVIIIGGLPLLWQTVRSMVQGKFNVDLIAIVSIFGGLFVHEYLAAAVIVLMMSGGEALEAYAVRRASGSLRTLLRERPRLANIWQGEKYHQVPAEDVKAGDRLLIKPGESVPVDAEVVEGSSEFDESLLTGESLPVTHSLGTKVLSGSINVSGPVTVVALVPAEESTYARIVELVRTAQERKGNVQRLADRFGVWFTPLTFLMVVLTWLFTHNLVLSYAVLVIATPCPLILATPIAIIAGIGRAAKLGIIVKSGESLEGVAQASTVLFDKTGTLTHGAFTLEKSEVHSQGITKDEALALCAALEQYSNHVVATSLVEQAKQARLSIAQATKVKEVPGKGMEGEVDGQPLMVGNAAFFHQNDVEIVNEDPHTDAGVVKVYLAKDGKHVATFLLRDTVRSESKKVIQLLLTQYGIQEIAMLTGDQPPVAEHIAEEIGMPLVHAALEPEDKVRLVEEATHKAKQSNRTVVMVGDGINDAPALERADIGIAIGRQGGEVAVEAADIVLLGGQLTKLPDAIRIGKAVLRIASQGIWFGMCFSFAGMIAAAFGYLPPIAGALSQEVIDVLVIVNALRVLRV